MKKLLTLFIGVFLIAGLSWGQAGTGSFYGTAFNAHNITSAVSDTISFANTGDSATLFLSGYNNSTAHCSLDVKVTAYFAPYSTGPWSTGKDSTGLLGKYIGKLYKLLSSSTGTYTVPYAIGTRPYSWTRLIFSAGDDCSIASTYVKGYVSTKDLGLNNFQASVMPICSLARGKADTSGAIADVSDSATIYLSGFNSAAAHDTVNITATVQWAPWATGPWTTGGDSTAHGTGSQVGHIYMKDHNLSTATFTVPFVYSVGSYPYHRIIITSNATSGAVKDTYVYAYITQRPRGWPSFQTFQIPSCSLAQSKTDTTQPIASLGDSAVFFLQGWNGHGDSLSAHDTFDIPVYVQYAPYATGPWITGNDSAAVSIGGEVAHLYWLNHGGGETVYTAPFIYDISAYPYHRFIIKSQTTTGAVNATYVGGYVSQRTRKKY